MNRGRPTQNRSGGPGPIDPRVARGGKPLAPRPSERPPLQLMTTTLWEYPSQHYTNRSGGVIGATMQGDKEYAGSTPSWVIWQCLQRYTRENDVVVDPMCGSGTTLDVCRDLGRRGVGFDLAPKRPDIKQSDARKLPLKDAEADFVFVDPPYSTHIDYSDHPNCIGKLDAAGADHGAAYYRALEQVIAEIDRILKPKRYMALYVSDSWRKRAPGDPGSGTGVFMPIGFELFAIMRERFQPVDIVTVVRGNQKLAKGSWHKAAEEGNYFMRGFNYLFIMKKP